MSLKYNEIPGSSELFLDYIYNFENVREFYESDFRSKENLNRKLNSIISARRSGEQIPRIIRKQYQNFKPSAAVIENLNKLEANNTLTVVTGQQLGIFGGPLYTIYKIITAIKLAARLNLEYRQYNFVPVFWLEGDDHDFDEIRSIKLVDENNRLVTVSYNIESQDEENPGSVGKIKIDNRINDFFSATTGILKETEFSAAIIERLRTIYSPGRTFSDAFKELIIWLFDKYGLIIFDPQDKQAKELLIPVFKKEIADFRQHSETVVKVSAKLEEAYHAQVKVRAINLFHSYDEGRYLIEPVDNEFRLKRKRKRFTFDEINDLIEKEPESFSPNVLLRPLCQDYLLSTAVYVAGPGEISYFSQALPLYEFYNITPPAIYPRASATLLEKNIASVLEKYKLNVKDILNNPEVIKSKILSGLSDQNPSAIFNTAESDLKRLFDNIREGLSRIDKTTGDLSMKYYEKVLNYLNELKSKTDQAYEKKHEASIRQLEKLSVNLYPDANLQEREMNLFYYLNKYGPGLLNKIYEVLDINCFEHQLIEL